MRAILLTLCAACASCFATSGDLDRAIESIARDIAVVAEDAADSAQAVRDAWQRGEITAAEMEKRLQDIRAAAVTLAKDAAREEMAGLQETIEKRPEAVVRETTETLAKRDAEDALYDFKLERTEEHLAKAEAKR